MSSVTGHKRVPVNKINAESLDKAVQRVNG